MPTDASHHPLQVTNWNRNALCFHCHLYYYLRKCLNSTHPSPFFIRQKESVILSSNNYINEFTRPFSNVLPYRLSRCCYLKNLTRPHLMNFHLLQGIRRKPLQLRLDLATRCCYNFHRCRLTIFPIGLRYI